MGERIMAVSAALPPIAVRSRDGDVLLRPGELLKLMLMAHQADGTVLLQGEGVSVSLRWPAYLPSPAPGSLWPFVVRAVSPRLELAWPQRASDQTALAPPEAGGRAWVQDAASAPLLQRKTPAPAQLAQDWQTALSGALLAESQRQVLREQRHFSAAWLQAGGGLPETPAAPALPLSLPFWLWGGPRVRLDLAEREAEASDALPLALADLVLEVELEEAGLVRLVLRAHGGGVALLLAASVPGCVWLTSRLPAIRSALRQAGLALLACHIVQSGPPRLLPGCRLPAMASRPLPLPLFEVAVLTVLACSPALAAFSPASRSG
ncbi:hypothetical protein EHS17_12790 [Rhodobacteraceae bacterium CH30]|nr:hypothetical protein EHS17_12790 [Rhodobacteraceae bacterium CH30]